MIDSGEHVIPMPAPGFGADTLRGGRQVLFRSAGRTGEFESVAVPHMNDLCRMATRLLGDSEKAADVVQEVYLQAWKSFDRFEPGTNCRAWLFKILFNSVHHYRRKWLNLRFVKESEEILENAAAYSAPIPDHVTDKEILAALDRIPPEYKAVVLLADVEDFAYKEIAGILGIPIGTVMSRLSRARKQLRDQLAETAQSYGIGKSKQEGQSA
jgi:RNA polymerase sigma-70 factor, ECF subfamily